MITHAASRKQYTVLLDRPEPGAFFFLCGIIALAMWKSKEREEKK